MKVPVAELRADKIGDGYVCFNCHKKQNNIIQQAVKQREPVTRKEMEDPDFITNSYWCNACGHRFRSNIKFDENKMCPNCGDKGYIQKEKTANRILRESNTRWEE